MTDDIISDMTMTNTLYIYSYIIVGFTDRWVSEELVLPENNLNALALTALVWLPCLESFALAKE